MSTSALTSQGMTLAIQNTTVSPNAYQTIGEVSNINGPGGSAQVIDVTDLASTAKEKKMGLPDEGQITFDINFIPTDTQHALLRTARSNRTLTSFRITFTDSPATTWTFNAYVTSFPMTNGVDDVTKGNVTLEVTGTITEA